jgi:hypothetical protein
VAAPVLRIAVFDVSAVNDLSATPQGLRRTTTPRRRLRKPAEAEARFYAVILHQIFATSEAQCLRAFALMQNLPFCATYSSDEVFIGFVVANPEPQKTVGPFKREGAMAQRHAGGVNFLAVPVADFLNCNERCCGFPFSNENCLSALLRMGGCSAW